VNTQSYHASFQILSRDFRRITEFIEPVDANLDTYSHRLFELLLRTCTEFESACKERLRADGYTSPFKKRGKPRRYKDWDIHDYKGLQKKLPLESSAIGVLLWRPQTVFVRPFDGWSKKDPPLAWYDAYNKVKHNRADQFYRANLENAKLALAGLFALLVEGYVMNQACEIFTYCQ